MSWMKLAALVVGISIIAVHAKLKKSNKYRPRSDDFSLEQSCSADTVMASSRSSEPPSGRLACKFQYSFNSDGRLVDNQGNGFQFDVHDDHRANQARYEEIGQLIDEIVYELLETKCGLVRYPIKVEPFRECSEPSNERKPGPELQPGEEDDGSFVFVSPDFEAKDKLLVLIHGSGVVRAGQWARRLIINDCLDSGTQIPYIKKALENGYGVIVMNTNHNRYDNGRIIPGSERPETHGYTVWQQLILCHKASSIALVAHSYGGAVTTHLLEEFQENFKTRVKAIALTDAVVHTQNDESRKYLKEVACNWVSSSENLGKKLSGSGKKELRRVSAGTLKHEETSWTAFNKVFEFIFSKIP